MDRRPISGGILPLERVAFQTQSFEPGQLRDLGRDPADQVVRIEIQADNAACPIDLDAVPTSERRVRQPVGLLLTQFGPPLASYKAVNAPRSVTASRTVVSTAAVTSSADVTVIRYVVVTVGDTSRDPDGSTSPTSGVIVALRGVRGGPSQLRRLAPIDRFPATRDNSTVG